MNLTGVIPQDSVVGSTRLNRSYIQVTEDHVQYIRYF
jgi:hypothetical protein